MTSKVIKFKAIDDDGNSYWPEVWSIEALLARKELLGDRIFSYQYQNEPAGGEGNFLNTTWLHYVKRGEIPPIEDLFIVQGVDPSFSEAARADWFVIATLGRDNYGQVYLLDISHSHSTLPQQLRLIKQQHGLWHPGKIVIEGGPGRALYDTLVSETTLPVTMISNTKRAKEDRIKTMSIPFQNKQVLLAGMWDDDKGTLVPDTEGLSEFISEWQLYPGGRYDDALDAVQMALEQIILEGAGAVAIRDLNVPIKPADSGKISIIHRSCNTLVEYKELGKSDNRRIYTGYCEFCQTDVRYSVEDKKIESVSKPVEKEDADRISRILGRAPLRKLYGHKTRG